MEGDKEAPPDPMQAERDGQALSASVQSGTSSKKSGPLSVLAKVWGAIGGGIEHTAVGLDKSGVDPNRIVPPSTGVFPRNQQTPQTETSAREPSQS